MGMASSMMPMMMMPIMMHMIMPHHHPTMVSGALGVHGPHPSVKALVVCNAFASSEPIELVRERWHDRRQQGTSTASTPNGQSALEQWGDAEKPIIGRTNSTKIPYKSCQQVWDLADGDNLAFSSASKSVGNFSASRLPSGGDPTLIIIPYRKDPESMTASFLTPSFRNQTSAQVVVVDAYQGADAGIMKSIGTMQDIPANTLNTVGSQNMRIGLYRNASSPNGACPSIFLSGEEGAKHVVVRVGHEGEVGGKFPPELLGFSLRTAPAPSSAPGSRSGSPGYVLAPPVLAMTVLIAWSGLHL